MDNDIYGHMNNVVHYSLFDSAVNGWLIEEGVLDIAKGDQIGLVVETGCRYFSEMAFPDVVTAGLRVARLGSTSVRYEVGLFSQRRDASRGGGFLRPCLCRSVEPTAQSARRKPARTTGDDRDMSEADRLTQLEMLAAEQDRTIEELSGQIAAQWKEIETLRHKLDVLTRRLVEL